MIHARLVAITRGQNTVMCEQCDKDATDRLVINDQVGLAFCPAHANQELERVTSHIMSALATQKEPTP